MEREANLRYNIFPIGKIGTEDKEVKINFVHSPNFKHAEELWNRRKNRINPKRIFVKMGFNATEEKRKEYLEAFDKVKYNKICFYSGETDIKDVVYTKRFEHYCYQGKRMETISYKDYCRILTKINQNLDVLKMLNGEKEFIRDI